LCVCEIAKGAERNARTLAAENNARLKKENAHRSEMRKLKQQLLETEAKLVRIFDMV
jgi:hypothetical protein